MGNIIKITLTAVLTTILHCSASGQAADKKLYEAYLSGSKTFWKEGVRLKEEAHRSHSDKTTLYELAIARFGLLNNTMKDQDEEMFDEYVDKTEDYLDDLIENNEDWGEPKALLASVYGLKMGYSPWKGIYLGSKSSSLLEEALGESNDSPLVWKLYANSKLFTPEMWGGDKQEALKAYLKSTELYEQQEITYNWLYLDALAWLGIAYEKNGKTEEAISTYKKALTIEPDFMWVKRVLLPQAENKPK